MEEKLKKEFEKLLEEDVMVYGSPPRLNKHGFVEDTIYVTSDLVPKLRQFISQSIKVAKKEERERVIGEIEDKLKHIRGVGQILGNKMNDYIQRPKVFELLQALKSKPNK